MHRLEHVSRYDMIAVLADGVLQEYDRLETLLEQASNFVELYNSSRESSVR